MRLRTDTREQVKYTGIREIKMHEHSCIKNWPEIQTQDSDSFATRELYIRVHLK